MLRKEEVEKEEDNELKNKRNTNFKKWEKGLKKIEITTVRKQA